MRLEAIALVSANEQLARFFEAELSFLPYCVERFSSAELLEDKYDCIVVDNDTVMDMRGEYGCPIINVSSYFERAESARLSYALPWPTPIGAILDALRSIEQERFDGAGEPTTLRESLNTVYLTDPDTNSVMLENHHVRLTPSELCVLEALCGASGEVVPREQLAQLLGADDGNITDVYICRLRKKLEKPLGRRLFFSERRRGYRTSLAIKK